MEKKEIKIFYNNGLLKSKSVGEFKGNKIFNGYYAHYVNYDSNFMSYKKTFKKGKFIEIILYNYQGVERIIRGDEITDEYHRINGSGELIDYTDEYRTHVKGDFKDGHLSGCGTVSYFIRKTGEDRSEKKILSIREIIMRGHFENNLLISGIITDYSEGEVIATSFNEAKKKGLDKVFFGLGPDYVLRKLYGRK